MPLWIFSQWPLFYLLIALLCIKLLGVFFAVEIFAKFTPLVDSSFYIQGAYNTDDSIRTSIVSNSAFLINKIVGPYLTNLVFSLISIIGLLHYYFTGGRRWVVLIFLFLPSAMVWTSIAGKESIFFGFTGVFIVIWSKYVLEDLSTYDVLILVTSLVVCSLFRPHYAAAFFWLLLSTYIVKNINNYQLSSLAFIFLSFFCLVCFFVLDEILWRAFTSIDPTARSSRFYYFGIEPYTDHGFRKYISLLLLGAVFGVVGPLPMEALSRIELFPFFLEGILILMLPILSLYIAKGVAQINSPFFYKIFWLSLVPAILILLLIHAPFGILNPGSAIRWRVNFEQIFYFAPMILIFRFMDAAKK